MRVAPWTTRHMQIVTQICVDEELPSVIIVKAINRVGGVLSET